MDKYDQADIKENMITKLNLENEFPFHAYFKEFYYTHKDLGPQYEDKHGFKYNFFKEYERGVLIYEKQKDPNNTCGC